MKNIIVGIADEDLEAGDLVTIHKNKKSLFVRFWYFITFRKIKPIIKKFTI